MQSLWIVGLTIITLTAPSVSASDQSPRLKYRSKGAPCACASGLGEAEISKAMSRLDALRESGPAAPPDSKHFTEQQPRRETDENRK
ncbi:MAG: hypothetical protein Q8M09_17595 [Pseudomonadota bacterium]|nr:hypothetical protein [Pseudomonadota bacterium]MDP1906033.1 hypothetical protein [Pseudomonadota bacterium]